MVCCVSAAKGIPQMTQIDTWQRAFGSELFNCYADWRSKIGSILPATSSPSTMMKLRLKRQQTPLCAERYILGVVERYRNQIMKGW